jgi:vitamin B12 transporter
MKTRLGLAILLMLTAGIAPVHGEEAVMAPDTVVLEDVLITGTRTPVPEKESTLSTTVIPEQEIEARQAVRLEEMLRTVPGAIINQTGSRGGETALYIRGGESDHSQVLLNGIRLNKAGGFFNFNALTVDNVERLEVVRGPMSALYGADAMTGVVNLITKKGTGKPTLTLNSAMGAHSENGNFISEQRASLLGAYRQFGYSVAYSRIDDNGILELNNRFASNVLNSRLDYDPLDNLSFTFTTLLVESRFGFPTESGGDRLDRQEAGGPGLDPGQNTADLTLALGLNTNYWPRPWWEHGLTLAYVHRDERYNDPSNPEDTIFDFGSFFFSRDLERRLSLDYYTNFHLGQKEKLGSISTLGVAARTEQLKSTSRGEFFFVPFFEYLKSSRRSTAFYAQQQFSFWNRLFVTGGLRLEDNSVFDQVEFSPRASASLRFPETDTTIRAAGGRAIKEPNFVETSSQNPLFLGNPNLKPEKNTSWEVGADQYLYADRIKLSLTYFENHFKDFITFVRTSDIFFTGTFENIGAVRTRGLELAGRAQLPGGLSAGLAYTHLFEFKVLDDGGLENLFFATGKHLIRRPRHTVNFDLGWSQGPVALHLNGLYVGRRDDSRFTLDFPFQERLVNGGYFIMNLAASYDVIQDWGYIKKVQLQARANNLLDRNYEEAYGFSSPRFWFLAGLRVIM